jgi:hypothetical protein
LVQQGRTTEAWQALASYGDQYAAAAAQVTGDPTSLYGQIARNTWTAAGADLKRLRFGVSAARFPALVADQT